MELREYYLILKKDFKSFLFVVVLIIAGSFAFSYLRPDSYDTSLILNISRIGTQETDQYRYDDFYRIQADEKFAETVVEWLKSPRISSDIYADAGIDTAFLNLRQLSRNMSPEKLSPQVVSVNFSSSDQKTAEKISRSIIKIISGNTQSLNKDQKDNTWFEIIPQEPITKRYHPDSALILMASLLFGLFVGFWVVMIRHYLEIKR